jgi:hypothetical protein
MKMKAKKSVGFPKRLKEGNAEVTIYRQSNLSRRLNTATGEIRSMNNRVPELPIGPTGGIEREFAPAGCSTNKFCLVPGEVHICANLQAEAPAPISTSSRVSLFLAAASSFNA